MAARPLNSGSLRQCVTDRYLLGEVGALVHRPLVDGGSLGEDEQPQREPVTGEDAELLLQVSPAAHAHKAPHNTRQDKLII